MKDRQVNYSIWFWAISSELHSKKPKKILFFFKKQWRGEVITSLCHGSKILVDNKPKIHLESKFSMFQTSSILFIFIWFVKYWRNFLDLIRKDRIWVWKTKKKTCVVLTYSVTLVREIRKSHVAVAQRRLRNVQKEHDTSAKLLFCQFKPIGFFPVLVTVAVVLS